MKTPSTLILCAIAFSLAISCNDIIEYSPYDADIQSKNLNTYFTENLTRIGAQANDSLTFAFLSDTHVSYDDFSDAVNSINKQSGIAFVAVCGDITDFGLAKEYSYYWNSAKKLHYPCITVIGNHDYLSNGGKIYKRMFGNSNFSFQYGAYKFIAFDDVVWEKNNERPDFEWLQQEVEESDQRCVLLSHIPPWTDQFTEEYAQNFYNIAANPKVLASFHGHQHSFHDTLIHNKRYVVSKAVFKREYYLIHLRGTEVNIEPVNF